MDRTKHFDATTDGGFGFLTEMSFLELQERLSLAKQARKEQEAAQREEIAREKADAEKALLGKIELIARARSENAEAAAAKTRQGIGRARPKGII